MQTGQTVQTHPKVEAWKAEDWVTQIALIESWYHFGENAPPVNSSYQFPIFHLTSVPFLKIHVKPNPIPAHTVAAYVISTFQNLPHLRHRCLITACGERICPSTRVVKRPKGNRLKMRKTIIEMWHLQTSPDISRHFQSQLAHLSPPSHELSSWLTSPATS